MITIRETITISKIDTPQRLAFGWASIIEENGIPVVDSQGDIISEDELEKAAYSFAEDCRKAGELHTTIGVGELVESFVFTKAKQDALGIDLGKVGWWVGFRLSPEVFAKVADGTYRAFSIGGVGQRVTINKSASPARTARSFAEVLTGRTVAAPALTPAQVIAKATAALDSVAASLAATESPLIRLIKSDAAAEMAAPRGGRTILEDMSANLRDAEDMALSNTARLSAMDRLAVQVPLAAAAVRALTDAAQAHKDGKLLDKARAVVSASENIAKAGDSVLLRLCRAMGR